MTKPRLQRVALLCVTACLSACTVLTPKYERPPAPVAPSFTGEAAASTQKAARDIEWQSFFVDERLKRLIAIALANNRDLRVSTLNVEQARATYGVRRADLWPSIGLGATAIRQPATATQPSRLYTVGLQVSSYEVDLFGRVHSLSEAAFSQYLATDEGRKAAQISLVAGVANAYFALQADNALLDLTRSTLDTRQESLKLAKLKFDNGAASELDFRQSEALLEGANVALAQTTRQRAVDENLLVLLLGQSLPDDLPAGLAITDQRLATDLPTGLPSEVLTLRPDVRQAEQQLIASNANIGAARAAFFPRISLTASVGTASTELSGLFKSGSSAWTFAPQIVLPIFDAGRNQANLDIAKVNHDIAIAQYEKAIQSAFREVQDALAGRATLGEQVRAQLALTHAEEVRFNLSDLRYRNGASSYLDVLDAQRSLFADQQASVQVQLAQVQSQVALYKALGGGWTEPPQGSNPPAAK